MVISAPLVNPKLYSARNGKARSQSFKKLDFKAAVKVHVGNFLQKGAVILTNAEPGCL